jgi:hypothetical protein
MVLILQANRVCKLWRHDYLNFKGHHRQPGVLRDFLQGQSHSRASARAMHSGIVVWVLLQKLWSYQYAMPAWKELQAWDCKLWELLHAHSVAKMWEQHYLRTWGPNPYPRVPRVGHGVEDYSGPSRFDVVLSLGFWAEPFLLACFSLWNGNLYHMHMTPLCHIRHNLLNFTCLQMNRICLKMNYVLSLNHNWFKCNSGLCVSELLDWVKTVGPLR